MILLFNMIRTVINRKKRFIYCTVKRLSHLLKHELILNEKFISKVKKAREIINERRNDKQSANKNILLNVSIKYLNIINCRDTDFISEIDFN